ncbi:MAG TPA: hypothetical protein PK156_45665 [Polyangium sp.]|nr:hypothetical protein [Polyangium sp.]
MRGVHREWLIGEKKNDDSFSTGAIAGHFRTFREQRTETLAIAGELKRGYILTNHNSNDDVATRIY